ncbi:unnamed protein product [Allacma fusca]|uniref:Uncharacterized protein n=1 Tax=Allacma fusca TaxID=39272 RepID=A0A8J2PG98_9HEXA|nr:unnamed protein product [Allacma fusca]
MIKFLVPLVCFAAVICNTEPIDTEEWPIFDYFMLKQTVDPRVLPGYPTWSAQSWYELSNERDRVVSELYPEIPSRNEKDLKVIFVTTPEEVIDAFFHSVLAPDDYEAAWSTRPFQTYVLDDDNVFNCGLLYILALVDENGLPVEILVMDDNEFRADEVHLTCVNIESALSPFGQVPPILELEFSGKIPQDDFTEELSEIEVSEEIILGSYDVQDSFEAGLTDGHIPENGFIQFGEGDVADETFLKNEFDPELSHGNFGTGTVLEESIEETTDIYLNGDHPNSGLFEPFPENEFVQVNPEDVLDHILVANDFDPELPHDNLGPGTITEENTEEITEIDYGTVQPDNGNFSPALENVFIEYFPEEFSEQFQSVQDFGEHLQSYQDAPSTVTEEIIEESTELEYSTNDPDNTNIPDKGFVQNVPENNFSTEFQGYDDVEEVQTIETTQVETTEGDTGTGMFKRNKLRFALKK